MNRPARKRTHLLQKIAAKTSRAKNHKPGKRAKRWRKWAEAYKAITE
jgi:hypothetical protein